jgi:hypothetical protein
MELERAHDLNRTLMDKLFNVNTVRATPSEPMEPLRPSGMSFKEAAKRVREFEAQVLAKKEEPDAGEISETIQTDADRASRGRSDGQGFAV